MNWSASYLVISSHISNPVPRVWFCTTMNIYSWKLITGPEAKCLLSGEKKKKKKTNDITIILILGPEKGRKSCYISNGWSKGGFRGSWQVHKVTIFESKVHIWSPINNLSIAQWSKTKLFRFIKHIQSRLLYIPNGWTDVPMQPIFSISDWFIIWEKLLTVYLLQTSNSSRGF